MNYYITALAETKSSNHSEQLEDKITKLERRHEPLNRQTPQNYTPQQNLCAKIYQYDLYWPLPSL
jgi:chaperonin cofactor prefoldin